METAKVNTPFPLAFNAPQAQPSTHPVELIEKTSYRNMEAMHNFTLTNIFGSHMNMRFQMDKEALSKFQRLPGMPSSFVGLDTMMNLDEDIDFGDYLKDPTSTPLDTVELRKAMERRLAL